MSALPSSICIRPMPQTELEPEASAFQPFEKLAKISHLAAEQVRLNDFDREERIREYRRQLVNANWFYEHSDSQSEWRAGRDEFTALIELQMELDPDASIWREVAPAQMACGLDIPQPRIVGGAL